jgi:hypothetical protein
MQGTELSAIKERQKEKKVRQSVGFIESHQMSENTYVKGIVQ